MSHMQVPRIETRDARQETRLRDVVFRSCPESRVSRLEGNE